MTRWPSSLVVVSLILVSLAALASPPELEIANGPLQAAAYFDPRLCPGAARGNLPGLSLLSTPRQGQGQGASLFQSSFDATDWSGHLSRLELAPDADGAMQIGAALWEAGAILTGNADPAEPAQPAPLLRKIYTINPDRSNRTIPFRWADLAQEQRSALDRAPPSGALDDLGEQRLAYLRGDRSAEVGQPGGFWRRRASVLGDAINSAPLYVGAPSSAIQGAGYDTFFERYKTRRSTVYLGANDGMLHAFDAADGHELFAYVPNALLPVLNQLSSVEYRHQPYVDGGAGIGEASLNGQWKTILVASLGAGAQGVFALDVTDPANFEGGSGALWEFTDQIDPAMGNLMAAPSIAKFKMGSKDGAPLYRYFAVVASGLNNYADDGKARFVASGAGALFLLALDKPAATPWALGVNYYKLTTPIADAGAANGLAPPALTVGGDGAVRFAYAGDLQGNLWRFDFSGNAPWSGGVNGQQPLFVARDGAGLRQPITQQAKVVFAHGGGYLILFGTGQLIGPADLDPSGFQTQSFYAIHDTPEQPSAPLSGRDALLARTLSGSVDNLAGFAISGGRLVDANSAAGWYVDFPHAASSGERSISSPVLAGGKVFFSTILPGSDPCVAAGVRTYRIDSMSGLPIDDDGVAHSGNVSGQLSADQVRGSPVVLETALGVGQRNGIGRASARKQYIVFNLGKKGATETLKAANGTASFALPAKRISWREIANWRELHDAAKK